MNKIKALLLVFALLFVATNVLAKAPETVRIRGTVTGFDHDQLQVRMRTGTKLKVHVPADTKINVMSPMKMSDIKQGSFVGVTAIQHGPGTPLQAREVHLFPEAQRGTGEGHYPWDLEPGSSMTNANVDAIVDTNNGEELTLSYKGGSQKIVVPKGVPVITFEPADRSLLKRGAKVFIITQKGTNGSLTAQRMLVGKDGMKPPM